MSASPPDTPVITVIKRIQSGEVDPSSMSKDDRQPCVEFLFFEGYTIPEISDILKKSEKTIRRDVGDIRSKNALTPDVNLAKQIVGEMVVMARMRQSRLDRLSKSRDGSVAEKSQAEYLAWRIAKEMVEKLQSLGYLPSKPSEIVGNIVHHASGGAQVQTKSLDEIENIIKEMCNVAEKAGVHDSEIEKEIQSLNAELERARLTEKSIKALESQKAKVSKVNDNEA